MNFICEISKQTIKKSSKIKVFFIESNNNHQVLNPFMNQAGFKPDQHFKPLSIPFSAKLTDNEQDVFNFPKSTNSNLLAQTNLFQYVNDNRLTQVEMGEKDLLSVFNKRDDENYLFDEIKDLESLLEAALRGAIYFPCGKFITVMFVLDTAYNAVIEQSNLDCVIKKFENDTNKEEYKDDVLKIEKNIKDYASYLKDKKGQKQLSYRSETVLIDDEIIAMQFKDSEKLIRHHYGDEGIENLRNELESKKGQTLNIKLRREYIVDNAFIELEVKQWSKSINTRKEFEICQYYFQHSSQNILVADLIFLSTRIKSNIKFRNEAFEALVFENEIGDLGYSFTTSRREILYSTNTEKKKDFRKLLSEL